MLDPHRETLADDQPGPRRAQVRRNSVRRPADRIQLGEHREEVRHRGFALGDERLAGLQRGFEGGFELLPVHALALGGLELRPMRGFFRGQRRTLGVAAERPDRLLDALEPLGRARRSDRRLVGEPLSLLRELLPR